jgi:hypothetical protein
MQQQARRDIRMNINFIAPSKPDYVESYIVIKQPVTEIHGYMALKEDHDDLGLRWYCEYQGYRNQKYCLLFSYVHDGTCDGWTYLLTDGATKLDEIADVLLELMIDIELVFAARDTQEKEIVDMSLLRIIYFQKLETVTERRTFLHNRN